MTTALLPNLTPREIQVVRLVAEGLTNAEIATVLCLSVGTVRTHLRNVCSKATLDAHIDQRWLVRVAYLLAKAECARAA